MLVVVQCFASFVHYVAFWALQSGNPNENKSQVGQNDADQTFSLAKRVELSLPVEPQLRLPRLLPDRLPFWLLTPCQHSTHVQ